MALFPADRLVDWTPGTSVGVPGGIPARDDGGVHLVNVVTSYGADPTGVADSKAAIQAAIDANANISDPANYRVLYLPAGEYKLDGANPLFHYYHSYLTLRGAGMGLTKLVPTGAATGASITDGASGDAVNVVGGLVKGAISNIELADTSTFSVGQLISFAFANDYDIPVFALFGFDLSTGNLVRTQTSRITALPGANKVSIFPPLYDDYGSGSLNAVAYPLTSVAKGISIEDLEIDCANTTGSAIALGGIGYGCWIKNVWAHDSSAFMISVNGQLNYEIRGCLFEGGTHLGHPLLYVNSSVAGLIEDNALIDGSPMMEVVFASAGNVVADNFLKHSLSGEGINACHDAHPSYNLYEGNELFNCAGIKWDGFHGSASDETAHRNLVAGYINVRRFTRNINSAGNVIELGHQYGYPNVGNNFTNGGSASLLGTAGASEWPDWQYRDFMPGTVTITGTSAVSTNAVFTSDLVTRGMWLGAMGGSGYSAIKSATYVSPTNITLASAALDGRTAVQFKIVGATAGDSEMFKERDLDCEATAIDKGNYKIDTAGYSSLSGDTLTDSLFRDSKPSWFGSLDWPPIDATSFQPSTFPHDLRVPIIGYGTLTRSGSTATIAYDEYEHGFSTGNTVRIAGANQTEYNGDFVVTVTSVTSFTYPISGSPATTATGTIMLDTVAHIDAYETAAKLIPAGYRYVTGEDPPSDTAVATPSFSPAAGTYSSAQSVTITCSTVGATIRYTVDGTTPTNSHGTVYTTPVSIPDDLTLKAIAYDGVLDDSSVRTGVYVIDTVVSSINITVEGTLTVSSLILS